MSSSRHHVLIFDIAKDIILAYKAVYQYLLLNFAQSIISHLSILTCSPVNYMFVSSIINTSIVERLILNTQEVSEPIRINVSQDKKESPQKVQYEKICVDFV